MTQFIYCPSKTSPLTSPVPVLPVTFSPCVTLTRLSQILPTLNEHKVLTQTSSYEIQLAFGKVEFPVDIRVRLICVS